MTTGGTESIIMACKAYRDYAREVKGTTKPNIVMPRTAHSGFDKAAQYLGLFVNTVPIDPVTTSVDLKAMEKAINKNTVMVRTIFIVHFQPSLTLEISLLAVGRFRTEFSIWNDGRH